MTALKRLPAPITFIGDWVNVQAVVAHLAGVAGIDQYYLNTFAKCFIANVLPQLVERPRIAVAAFGFAARLLVSSISNPRKIFKRDGLTISFSMVNQAFTYPMIHPRLKAFLSASQPSQQLPSPSAAAARALTGFFLENCSHQTVMVADLRYDLTAV
jgi:hypothetical protein